MNEGQFTDEALDDQLRRFYEDVYEPLEPASHTWQKLVSQLDGASPLEDGALTTPPPPSARESTLPQALPYTWGMRHRLRSAVAVLLTGFIIVATLALLQRAPVQSIISSPEVHLVTPLPYSTTGVPVTPVATPGPQHTYVTDIVTAQGVSTDFAAINQTSHFKAGQTVIVLCLVRGIAKGQKHTISIHWFYDGVDMQLPIVSGKTSEEITSNQVVYFSMQYSNAGLGMAKVFFDLPSTDTGDQANDPYLAGQILFAIDPATAGAATASPNPAG